MIIEIDETVLSKAKANKEKAVKVIDSIAFARKKGRHILYGTKKVLQGISSITTLDNSVRQVFRNAANGITMYGSVLQGIPFKTIVTYNQHTSRNGSAIYINPENDSDFCFEEKLQLLTENTIDAKFFKYLIEYYQSKHTELNGISVDFSNLLGGGDTSFTIYRQEISSKNRFCLAILDGDKKSSDANEPFGDTYKKVEKADDKAKPFNCRCYGTIYVREVENLIPYGFIASCGNYAKVRIICQPLSFEHSYFDFKEGLYCHSISNDRYYNYWKNVMSGYPDIVSEIELTNEYRELCTSNDNFKKDCGRTKILEGFGGKLLEVILKECDQQLHKVEDANLTDNQRMEWSTIGGLIFEWGCSLPYKKIAL